jgi:hypothetical protein
MLAALVTLGAVAACARGIDALADFGFEEGGAGSPVGAAGASGSGPLGSSAGGAAGDSADGSRGGTDGVGTSMTGGFAGNEADPRDGPGGAAGSAMKDGSAIVDARADRFDASSVDRFDGAGPASDALADVACPGVGTALSFERTRSTVVVIPGASLPLGNAARTVEMWVMNPSPEANWAASHTIFEYGGRGDLQAFAVDLDLFPNIELYVNPAAQSLFFNSGAIQDRWFHLAATYDGTVTHAFVDGVEKASKSVGPIDTQASSLYVGAGILRNYMTGSIDEVRVWNVARTQAQILGSMGFRLAGNEPGLVGYWRFDDGAGSSAADATAGNHPGALTSGLFMSGPMWTSSGAPLGCR